MYLFAYFLMCLPKLGKIITGNSFIIFFFFYYSFSSDSNILIVTVNRINLTGVAGI